MYINLSITPYKLTTRSIFTFMTHSSTTTSVPTLQFNEIETDIYSVFSLMIKVQSNVLSSKTFLNPLPFFCDFFFN